MSKQLHIVISNCLKLTGIKNEHSRSGDREDIHEYAISDILDQAGFTKVIQQSMGQTRNGTPKKLLKFKDLKTSSIKKALQSNDPQAALLKLVPDLAPGSYICQPCSGQHFPDFLVRDFDGRIILIEAKSGNGVCPTWNDNLPKKDAIYIFTSTGKEDSTIFLGQDVLPLEVGKLLTEFHAKQQAEADQFNSELEKLDITRRGFERYVRPKFIQGGGDDKVNYFKHTDRAKCEKNALDFALGK
jgi:hypothetical protein